VLAPVLLGSTSSLPPTGVAPGGSVFLVNGAAQPVTVVPNSRVRPTALLASGAGLAMRFAGLDQVGRALGVTGEAALVLRPDHSIAVEGSGVAPNSDVPIYLFSSPRLLGTVQSDAAGSFKGVLPVPKDVALGKHTLQVNALGADGAVRSLSLGVVLQAPKAVAGKVVKATVSFAPGSAWLSSFAKTTLAALAKKVGAKTTSGLVLGYVQPYGNGTTSPALALKRARAVAAYLATRGIKARLATRGDGTLPVGMHARRVVVTLRYVP
jgi:outer membrane protein OmpA-like peptidoglycan-associated protein